MRISYRCPDHIKFALTIERWTSLVRMTRESIDWLDKHEKIYDTWLLIAYAATSCALVQYHTWARRRDPEAMASLKKLRDCVQRWEDAVKPEHMSTRRRTTEIISLLYEATQRPDQPSLRQGLNPTAGVSARAPDSFKGLTFKKDKSRPGGGVFVANERTKEINELLEGTVVAPGDIVDAASEEGVEEGAMKREGGSSSSSGVVAAAPMPPSSRSSAMSNVNPELNDLIGNQVQVLNILDVGHASGALQEQLTVADTGYMEGLPTGIFDWEQFDGLFTRFADPSTGAFGYVPPHTHGLGGDSGNVMPGGGGSFQMAGGGVISSTFPPYTPALYPGGGGSHGDGL